MNVQGSEIAIRIDSSLAKMGKKRKDVAEYANISTQAITEYARKGRIPALDTALKIAEFLGVSLKWLATGEAEHGYSQQIQDIINMLTVLDNQQLQVVNATVTTLYNQAMETKNAALN